MQTTLLGLAIACIMALLSALIGPYFVNWNDQRAFFEAEASRLVGLEVQVKGPIDVRMLPFPSVSLGDIAIGPVGQPSRLRARSLGLELALGPLMKGEMRATVMRLAGPEFSVGINSLGRIDWPAMTLAGETLSIDRLEVEDGHAVLADAVSGSRLVLDKLWFKGQVRSLSGPVSGEGAFVSSGSLYGYRLEAGRFVDDAVRVKLSLDTAEQPFSMQTEGQLAFDRSSPRFDGNLTLARPVGTPQAGGKMAVNEPWRLTGKLRASPQSALLEQVEFQYGPDERAAKLAGTAEFTFGEKPKLQGALSARQVDLDQLLATADVPRRLPLAAMQAFVDRFGSALKPPLPVRLGLSVDALTVGGATLQAFGSDLRSDGEAWQLDKLDFRAPGFTKVSLSGRVDTAAKGLGFAGAASVDANDPKALVAWLAGHTGATAQSKPGQVKPWKVRGDVTLGADRIAIDRLKTEFERGTVEGRLAYVWPAGDRPARLDADLSAGDLDVDGLIGFGNSAFAGMGLDWPRDVSLALEIGKARLAGFEALKTSARMTFDANGIAIERLSVADFGQASVSASGRIATGASPGGNIALDLDARDLNGIIALADKFAAPLASPLRTLAGRQKTAKIHADLSLEQAGADKATARLALAGRVGALGVRLTAGATGKPDAFTVTDWAAITATEARIDAHLDADDGGVLLTLLGLGRFAPGDKRAAQFDVTASGPLSGELALTAKLAAGGMAVDGKGTARITGDRPASATLDPFAGVIGGSKVQGRLAFQFAEQTRIDGTIETDQLDAPALIAAAIGMPASRTKPGEPAGWSPDPFTLNASDIAGRIEFNAKWAVFSPTLTGRQLRGTVRFEPSEVAFDDVAGELAGGRLNAHLTFTPSATGTSAKARLTLQDADVTQLIRNRGGWPAMAGRAGLQVEVAGSGLSPAAFIGSVAGSGAVTLEDGQLSGVNPRVFDALTRAVDLGIPTDANRIKDFVGTALDNGVLPVSRVDAGITVNAGVARLTGAVVRSKGADLALTGNINLADAAVDALLTLSGKPDDLVSLRPTVFVTLRGPVASPGRTIDANALAGWIALRAVEQQSQRLEAMEKARAALIPVTPADPTPNDASAPQPDHAIEAAPVAPLDATAGPAAEQAPPLPPAIVVMPPPRPQAAPRVDNGPTIAPAKKPAPARPTGAVTARPSPGPPLNLLGAQN